MQTTLDKGRQEREVPPIRICANRVKLDDQGYDSLGKYWGLDSPLYYVVDPSGFDLYIRASNPESARAIFRRKQMMTGLTER